MKKTSSRAADRARSIARPTARPTKEWTVMIYMIADDPGGGELLDQVANRELDQIIHATLGTDREKLYVTVQLDFRSQPDVWRRVVGEGAWAQPEGNAADPETLYGYFEWVSRTCPADRYLLMLWGHSKGPFGLFSDEPVGGALGGAFAKADPWTYVAQTLTLPELRSALRAAKACFNRKVDIIAFKDCFMSTLETAYELKDAAAYLIASPGIVPVEGWPYSKMLEQLAATRDPAIAARKVVGELHTYYADPKNRPHRKEVPFALLDTSQVPAVSEPLRAVAARLDAGTSNSNGGNLRKAVASAADADPALIDVERLCRTLKARRMREPAERLEAAIKKLVREGRVSLFCYPFSRREQRRSIVAAHATRYVYGDLAIVETGWNDVALKAMPKDTPPPTNGARGTLLPVIFDQLQRRGVLEEIGRKGLDVLRRTISGLAREAGFGPKEAGFGPKEAGFGPKEAGFAEQLDDKEAGFAAAPPGRRKKGKKH
jgi:cysteine peptidase C11 family protein